MQFVYYKIDAILFAEHQLSYNDVIPVLEDILTADIITLDLTRMAFITNKVTLKENLF